MMAFTQTCAAAAQPERPRPSPSAPSLVSAKAPGGEKKNPLLTLEALEDRQMANVR